MARQPSAKPNDPAQYQRFRDLAAELGADKADDKALRIAVKRLGKAPRPPKKHKAGRGK